MKVCFICKLEKPKSEFYFHNRTTARLSPYCKPCAHKKNSEWRKQTGYYRSEKVKNWRNKNGYNTYERRKDILAKYYQTHKDQIQARAAVRRALLSGKLARLPCNECGEMEVQAHHVNGYDKENQLNIIWLCQEHHRQAHHE